MLKVFNLPIDALSLEEVLAKIKFWLAKQDQHLIFTVNPEILLKARRNYSYHQILKQAALRVADGMGVIFISYLFGSPLKKGRVRGVDLVKIILQSAKEKKCKVFITGWPEQMLFDLASKYGSNVDYAIGPLFNNWDVFPLKQLENDQLLNKISDFKPDILLVGFGAPKQERWLHFYMSKLPLVKIGINVGGSFDYLAGMVKMPPKLLGYLGLEWLWRVLIQPWRLFRIINAVVIFPILAIFDYFKGLFHVEQ